MRRPRESAWQPAAAAVPQARASSAAPASRLARGTVRQRFGVWMLAMGMATSEGVDGPSVRRRTRFLQRPPSMDGRDATLAAAETGFRGACPRRCRYGKSLMRAGGRIAAEDHSHHNIHPTQPRCLGIPKRNLPHCRVTRENPLDLRIEYLWAFHASLPGTAGPCGAPSAELIFAAPSRTSCNTWSRRSCCSSMKKGTLKAATHLPSGPKTGAPIA
jgi:hypothetical protein